MPRGPSYPSIPLGDAVELADRLHKFAGTQPVAVGTVLTSPAMLDSSAKSTAALKKVAALKYFGLVDEIAGASAKQIQISKRAQHIRLDDGREEALQEAFLSPKHYRFCWEHWGRDLPNDDAIKSHLIIHRKFIETTVGGFIANYKESLAYSGLLDRVDEDDAVEEQGGTDTALAAAATLAAPKGEAQPPPPVGTEQATFPLLEGQALLQWPSKLTQASYDDLTDWVDLMLRRAKRSIVKGADDEADNSD